MESANKTSKEIIENLHNETCSLLKKLNDSLNLLLTDLDSQGFGSRPLENAAKAAVKPLSSIVNGEAGLNEEDTGAFDKLLRLDFNSRDFCLTPDEVVSICGVYNPKGEALDERGDCRPIIRCVLGDEAEDPLPVDLNFLLAMWHEEKFQVQEVSVRSELRFISLLFEFAAKWNILTPEAARWYLARSKASNLTKATIAGHYGISANPD